jgi:signal transduction histidine kinase
MGLQTEFISVIDEGLLPPAELFRPTSPEALVLSPAALAAATMQELIDDLPEQIALLDEQGTILVANRAWNKTVIEHGYLEVLAGGNYRDFCAEKAAEGYHPAVEAIAAIDDICSGKRNFWQLIYNGQERWDGRDFQICIHRIAVGKERLISVTRFDLTEILQLRLAKDAVAHSFVEGQATERQRMARELHDSTSQSLVAIDLLLGHLKRCSQNREVLGVVAELQQLVGDTQREIRSISYLAHPPALQEHRLPEAIKSVVEGFGRRTQIQTSFEIEGDARLIPLGAETALYRVAQEALSNIHRHARPSRARLLLRVGPSATHLVIADDGVGIARAMLDGGSAGVGIASMRTRLREIGGRLGIFNLSPGTAIVASVPTSTRGRA